MIWWTPIVVVGVILLKRDSLCQGLNFNLKETNVTAKEGECVQIHCIGSDERSYKSSSVWFWLKNSYYNGTLKIYQGTIVYSTNPQRKADKDFEGRVKASYPSPSPNQFKEGQGWEMDWNLEICRLRMDDSGNYSFRYVGDPDTKADTKADRFYTNPVAKLQVHENPCKVSFQTPTINLTESNEAVFNCSTSSSCGTQPVIKGLPTHAQLNESTSTSAVARLRVDWTDHQRVLSCDVPGLINECLRQNFTLTVQYSPRKPVVSGKMGKSVTLGKSLTLTCSTEAFPAPTYYDWFHSKDWKNGTTHSPGRLTQTSSKLEIERVTRADHGCYRCSASNPLGRGENSSSYCVEVLFAPTLPVLSVVRLATEGDVITIYCSVESWPLPSSLNLSWSSAREPHIHHLLHRVSNASSLIKKLNVTHASAGHYTCRAQNSQGSNQSETELTVNYAPQNVSVKEESSLTLTEGASLKLFCKAQSVPEVSSYIWTRTSAGPWQVVGSNQSLDIVSVTAADHGRYRCKAQNLVGTGESREVMVTVLYPPKYANITGLSGDEYDADVPIQLSCHGTSVPAVHLYKWYKKRNNKSKEEPVQSSQNLTVNPDRPGIYHCHAANSIGGTNSNQVQLFLNTGRLKEIYWAIPFVCILVLVVIIYLVFRCKRNKLVSHGSSDPLSRPVTPSTDSRGSREAPQSRAAGPERQSTIDTVYSTVKLPTGMQPISEDHNYAGDEMNYASLHFPTQNLSQGCSPPAVMENDVHAKIANKNYENLDVEDNQMVDIELNYSQVNFMAKRSKTRKTRKTTR